MNNLPSFARRGALVLALALALPGFQSWAQRTGSKSANGYDIADANH